MASSRDFITEARGGGGRVLLGAFLGSALSVSAVPFFTLGVFVGPLQEEFGWSRADIQASLAWSMLGMVLAAVPTGWLTDRLGARRVAIFGMVAHSVSLLLLGLAGPSLWAWHLTWLAMSFFSSGSTALTWTRGVSDWFSKGRGLALGITLMGNGVTGVLAPPFATAMIDMHGWREALFLLSATTVVLGVLPTWLFFRERPETRKAAHADLSGLTMREAFGGYRLWLVTIAFVFLSFGVAGSIPNLVPLMLDRGFTPLQAASMASLIGFAVIFGRIGAGWLFDRVWAPGAGAAMLMMPVFGSLLLASPDAGTIAIAIAVLSIGLIAGMEFDLMGYLVARYFGFRNYGKIFAAPWIGFAAGAGTGATLYGWVYDMTGSYVPVLFLTAGTFFTSGMLLLAMGRYPDQPRREAGRAAG